MDLSLTENQELLKSTAREFIELECPKDVLLEMEPSETGVTDQTWQKAAEIGWLGMIVPEEYGGIGSSLTDAAVVFEQLGAGPLSGPFFSSGVLGASIVLEAASGAQKRELLPRVADGQEVVVHRLDRAGLRLGAGVRSDARPGAERTVSS